MKEEIVCVTVDSDTPINARIMFGCSGSRASDSASKSGAVAARSRRVSRNSAAMLSRCVQNGVEMLD